ncbi:MAG: hypothetical protein OEY06_06115 [Gammaproteobacteria bacterium]|nr:hypothetical protein [Gammaproteobacteria bacterium]
MNNTSQDKLFFRLFLSAVLLFSLIGCTSLNEQSASTSVLQIRDIKSNKNISLREKLLSGNYEQALAELEKDTSSKNNVFLHMNRGLLRRMTGDYVGSNQSFEIAKNLINSLYGVSVSEELGAAALTDIVHSYSGYRYEQALLHAYIAMNYAQMNDLESARVEILQADLLMNQWSDVSDNDPFVRYFAGLIFEALGEYDEALIAYRKAINSYKKQLENKSISKIPPMVEEDLLILLADEGIVSEATKYRIEFKSTYSPSHEKNVKRYTKNKDYGELVIIFNYGVAPSRINESDLIFAENLIRPGETISRTANYQGARIPDIRAKSKNFSIPLEMTEDIEMLAKSTQHDLSGTGIRVISNALSNIKNSTSFTFNDFLKYIRNTRSDLADKRSWVSLPNKILMNRLILPIGKYDITITMPNEHGHEEVIASDKITIKHGSIMFSSMHGVAPKADETLRMEANQNDKNAQYKLAKRLERTYGLIKVDKSNSNALSWYLKAAESGHEGAQYFLSSLYSRGVTKRIYTRSNKLKSDSKEIKRKIVIKKDIVKSRKYLKMASDNHHPIAMQDMANAYQYGWYSTPKDLNKALILLKEINSVIETDKYNWSVDYALTWGSKKLYMNQIKFRIKAIERIINR